MDDDDDGFDLSQGLRSICTSVHGANRGKASVHGTCGHNNFANRERQQVLQAFYAVELSIS